MHNNIENDVNIDEKRSLIQDLINSIKNKLEKENILVIDRFEGDFAVCENRKTGIMLNINKNKLPKQAVEGDVLKFVNNKYELDENEKEKIENRINNKVKNLFND